MVFMADSDLFPIIVARISSFSFGLFGIGQKYQGHTIIIQSLLLDLNFFHYGATYLLVLKYYHIGLTLHLNPQPASSIAPFFEFVLSVQQSSAVEIVNRRVKQYVWQTYIAETFFVSPRKKLKIFQMQKTLSLCQEFQRTSAILFTVREGLNQKPQFSCSIGRF